MIEEYKTLREEIARFQNQQKQSLTVGVGSIALALFASVQQNGGTTFVTRPYLLLVLPLILAPIGIMYFETEISIFRAATYLGTNLKKAAEELCGPLKGVWDWENYRAKEKLDCKKIENYGGSKWILFLWPSPICVAAFIAVCFLQRPEMNRVALLGHVLLSAIDIGLIIILGSYYRKADRMWKRLDDTFTDPTSPPEVAAHQMPLL